jgi:NAD+ synthase
MAPPDTLSTAIAQLNPVGGYIAGNRKKARAARAEAARRGAELVVFTEIFIGGYPPEDLILKPSFVAACEEAVNDLAAETGDGGPGVLIGTPWRGKHGVHNAVALLDGGKVAGLRFKAELPNYGVFDEKRVFVPGPLMGPLEFRGVHLGVPICEDIWERDVVETLCETGAELLIVPNGSPYWRGKPDERIQIAALRVAECGLALIYTNQNCGQDDLIFDGGSFALNGDSSLAFQLPTFAEGVTVTTWRRDGKTWRGEGPKARLLEGKEADYAACVLGLRDYVSKNGFPGVVNGLSGGIDSALCAAIAVDALGADKVHCIMLPYRFTSEESLGDAAKCANALGVRYDVVPIKDPVEGFEGALAGLFKGTNRGITEENLQSRVRGTILMSISNKFGPMVVTTGNKSEMSVGYATLYGDMNGGYNPIKDLYKTEVFHLSELRNRWKPVGALGPDGEVIPQNIITKPPSAELRENQKDQDSLPPYEVLDAILERLVEGEDSVAEIIAAGFEPETVKKVERLLYLAEYKRRQAAPGVKVTRKNFGRDRRYPITNRFRDEG